MHVQPSGFHSDRAVVLDWAERGAIPKHRLVDALAVAGVTPIAREWRAFLNRLLLCCGAACLGAAAIFFIAANWTALGKYAKFGLVEALIVGSILAAWKLGIDRLPGKAALLLASLAMGGLLALFGQTYQTGADTWELFATWAGLILPWILVARFAALWIVWMAIVNLAIGLYFSVFPAFLGIIFSPDQQMWALFIVNTLALGVWQMLARRVQWLDERWAIRLLFASSGAILTFLVGDAIADRRWPLTLITYPGWLVATYAVYRQRISDLFMLAGACLSVIVSVTVFLVVQFAAMAAPPQGVFLLTALAVVGMTAAAAVWLRKVAAEPRP